MMIFRVARAVTLVALLVFCSSGSALADVDVTGAPAATGPAKTTLQEIPDQVESDLLAEILIRTWESLVPEEMRPDWRVRMQALVDAADPLNLRIAAEAHDYEQALAALGGGVDPKDPLAPLAIGSLTSDLSFTPVLPCRLVDTREAGGAIAGNSNRQFAGRAASFAGQGGSSSDCAIPVGIAALSLNVTVVDPAGPGFATAYPGNQVLPLASTVNYTTGDVVGNAAIVRVSPTSEAHFRIYSWQTTDVVVDVNGYYIRPEATALQCVTEQQFIEVAAGGIEFNQVDCPSGYTATGGGCFWRGSSDVGRIVADTIGTSSQNLHLCRGRNTSSTPWDLFTRIRCCRVPGR